MAQRVADVAAVSVSLAVCDVKQRSAISVCVSVSPRSFSPSRRCPRSSRL